MSDTITVYAPGNFDYLDSYGLIACQLARHLTALGIHVNAVGMGKTVMDSQPDDVRAVTSRPLRPSLGGIVLGYPTGYHQQSALLHCGPRVAVTMFESSKIPPNWIEPLNQMDAVVVPSTFCRDVFKACGVTVPVHVVPLGVGEVYQYAERPKPSKTTQNHPKPPLTFLAFLDRGKRKGFIVALQAFLRAFGESMDYRLILKGRKAKVPLVMTNTNIEVVQQDMSEEELYQLYLRADVLINPHKGEGFGIIPREFAGTGGVSLTTNWSGTADDLSEWGWSLPYSLERADWEGHRNLAGQDLGEWAAPDTDGVASKLLHVAAHIDAYRVMARYHAQRVLELYSWRAFAERVLGIWREIADGYRNRLPAIAA